MTSSTRQEGGRTATASLPAGIVRAGFIPLLDAAPLIVARDKGFDAVEGFKLSLSREASWANIRDKVAFGAFDCAHMLAPMPIASVLGLTPTEEPVITPMSLNRGGSSITLSVELFDEMMEVGPADAAAGGLRCARAFAGVVRRRRELGAQPLTLGMVFPYSSHNFDLRYWLADAGLDPDDDVNLVVIPPPLLAESLARNRVDGFCVGAPWGSVAVEASGATIAATKSEIWPAGPEKVLGVREDWANANSDLLSALIRALTRAALWLDDPANHEEAARILERPVAIGVPAALLLRALRGRLVRRPGTEPDDDAAFLTFFRDGAGVPWRNHALWIMSQMIRWGLVRTPFSLQAKADRVYRPDLYRAALAPLGVAVADGAAELSGLAAHTPDAAAAISYAATSEGPKRAFDVARFEALNP